MWLINCSLAELQSMLALIQLKTFRCYFLVVCSGRLSDVFSCVPNQNSQTHVPCDLLLPDKDYDCGNCCTTNHTMNTGLMNPTLKSTWGNRIVFSTLIHIHESTNVIKHDVSDFCWKMPYEFTGCVNSSLVRCLSCKCGQMGQTVVLVDSQYK